MFVIAIAACGPGKQVAVGPPPPPGSTWRADLQCREDPGCSQRGSDCTTVAPPVGTPQCGGTERPPTPPEEEARSRDARKAQIDAQTLPCKCSCEAAEAAERQACIMAP
jgi:hypothetical protein